MAPRTALLALAAVLAAGRPGLAHPELPLLERAIAEELASHPDNAELHLRHAQVHQVAGEWEAALAALDEAAARGADAAEVAAARGRVLLDAGRSYEAKRACDRALARRPDAAGAAFTRGRAWMRLGKPARAARDFREAVAGLPAPTPDHVFAWRDALLAAGDPAAGVAALDAGIGRVGPVAALELAALDLELDLGRPEAALARLDRLLARHPGNAAWVARRGEILDAAGHPAEARRAYAAALELIAARGPARRARRTAALARRLETTLATPTEDSR